MNGKLPNVSIDSLKVAYLPSPSMKHEQRPSTNTNIVDEINKNIVLADKNQSNCVTGSNNVNGDLKTGYYISIQPPAEKNETNLLRKINH